MTLDFDDFFETELRGSFVVARVNRVLIPINELDPFLRSVIENSEFNQAALPGIGQSARSFSIVMERYADFLTLSLCGSCSTKMKRLCISLSKDNETLLRMDVRDSLLSLLLASLILRGTGVKPRWR